jgi:acetyl esterase/lipase
MPSLRARLLNRYIRSTLKPVFADQRLTTQDVRKRVDAKLLPFTPTGVEIEAVTAPVRGEWHRPAMVTTGRAILYFHGGGYVFGSPESHRHLTFRLAKAASAPVFSLEYRLAPEHPCPAAIDDALACWDWLIAEGFNPGEIFVGGDSAGGGLTLALLQAIQARKGAMPGGAFLYSPWTDLATTGASLEANEASDRMFTAESIRRTATRYSGDLRLDDPRVSPLYGSFEGMPPLLIFVSDDEVLRDDSLRLAERVKQTGGEVELKVENGLAHVWPLFCTFVPEGARAVRETADFMLQYWNIGRAS